MDESRYGKYIITELKQGSKAAVTGQETGPAADMRSHTPLLYLDDQIIRDAFYVECV